MACQIELGLENVINKEICRRNSQKKRLFWVLSAIIVFLRIHFFHLDCKWVWVSDFKGAPYGVIFTSHNTEQCTEKFTGESQQICCNLIGWKHTFPQISFQIHKWNHNLNYHLKVPRYITKNNHDDDSHSMIRTRRKQNNCTVPNTDG